MIVTRFYLATRMVAILQSFYKRALLASFRGADTFGLEKSLLPLSSSFLVSCFRRRIVVEYRAQNKIGTPLPYSRSGNQDMQVPTNTVGRGLTSLLSSLFLSLFFSFFFFSLSFTLFLSHILTYTQHTYMHILPLSLSLSFFHSLFFSFSLSFFILLSISSSLSAAYEHLNGTISPFVGNGAFGGAIRRATR